MQPARRSPLPSKGLLAAALLLQHPVGTGRRLLRHHRPTHCQPIPIKRANQHGARQRRRDICPAEVSEEQRKAADLQVSLCDVPVLAVPREPVDLQANCQESIQVSPPREHKPIQQQGASTQEGGGAHCSSP